MQENNHTNGNNRRRRGRSGISLTPTGLLLLILVNLLLLAGLVVLARTTTIGQRLLTGAAPETPQLPQEALAATALAASELQAPTPTVNIVVSGAEYIPIISGDIPEMVVLAMSEAGYSHLFAYFPEDLSMTRLTSGEWDDESPSISPDGTRVAFSSNQNGYWDIYILDLLSGDTQQLTDDAAYDGAPAWSPDGQWLAFEKYVEENLDLYIQPPDGSLDAIRVTFNSGVDTAPAWKPDGQLLAFASSRNGDFDIYAVDIDRLGKDDYLSTLVSMSGDQHHPAWSPNNKLLAWSGDYEGVPSLFLADTSEEILVPDYLGSGTLALWAPSGQFILAGIPTAEADTIAVYQVNLQTYKLPPQILSGSLNGFTWGANPYDGPLPAAIQNRAMETPQVPWLENMTPAPVDDYGRYSMIELDGVNAPDPTLNELVIDSFYALQSRIEHETGWDVLSELENVFIPLTAPLSPGLEKDWLYTGRAITLNRELLHRDYMKVTRQDFSGRTYWQVFIRPLAQDGSQGKPLTEFTWDFNARFSGDTQAYEQGGANSTTIPNGYWINFTSLAAEHGWHRQAAISNWRSYYQGARFNQFIADGGLTWEEAMLQIYPPEIFQEPISPTGQ